MTDVVPFCVFLSTFFAWIEKQMLKKEAVAN